MSRSKTPPSGVLPYIDVVEEALCFGWIDSTLKRLPDDASRKTCISASVERDAFYFKTKSSGWDLSLSYFTNLLAH